jgi:hypothetical protein
MHVIANEPARPAVPSYATMSVSLPLSRIDDRLQLTHATQPAVRRSEELIDDRRWPFTNNNDDDGFSIGSETLEVHVDFDDRRVTALGELVLATVDTFSDLFSLLIEVNPGIIAIGPKPHLDRLFDLTNLLGLLDSSSPLTDLGKNRLR